MNTPGPLSTTIENESSEAEKRESLRRVLHITSWDNTFDTFQVRKGNFEALKACKQIAAGAAPWHMTMIYGSAGCGKTHLLEALSIAFLAQGVKVPVWEYSELMRMFKRAMGSNIDPSSAYDILFERYRQMPRLLLDDVAANGQNSAWVWGEFEDIINYRYRNNLLTVVTTNLDLNKLPDRAMSRFYDGVKSRVVLNEATDYRPEKKR